MWSFIAKIATYTWKYGSAGVRAAVAWTKANWPTVKEMIDAGVKISTIVEKIMRIVGY